MKASTRPGLPWLLRDDAPPTRALGPAPRWAVRLREDFKAPEPSPRQSKRRRVGFDAALAEAAQFHDEPTPDALLECLSNDYAANPHPWAADLHRDLRDAFGAAS